MKPLSARKATNSDLNGNSIQNIFQYESMLVLRWTTFPRKTLNCGLIPEKKNKVQKDEASGVSNLRVNDVTNLCWFRTFQQTVFNASGWKTWGFWRHTYLTGVNDIIDFIEKGIHGWAGHIAWYKYNRTTRVTEWDTTRMDKPAEHTQKRDGATTSSAT